MVRRFIAGVCGSNGGSKPPPYTIDSYTAELSGHRREGSPFYRECVRGELCVHLIYFAHLHFRAGSSLFMGWFPTHPPAYYCALNIDTLSRGTAPRPPKALSLFG